MNDVLDGRFRFEAWIVGSANRLAISAAKAVAEAPGSVYTPLFLHSASGLGKTHLLAAIGHHVRTMHPTLSVEYVALEDLVDELHVAIASGQADALKRRYATLDVLLLDDLQLLAGRQETQSEVLRLFNAMQSAGRQIVLAGDRAPADMHDVDDRLLTRLAGGLIVDIGPPDYETRLAILTVKCAERGTRFAPGVLEEVARAHSASVRELQGVLHRLVAHQAMLDAPLGVSDVWQVLGAVMTPSTAKPDEFENFLHDIASSVAESMESWRVRLSERIAYWSGEGFRTNILQRALESPVAPDVDSLDASFANAAERLRALEREAIRLDQRFVGMPAFRDPDALNEAEALVARALILASPPAAPLPEFRLAAFSRCAANREAIEAAAAIIESSVAGRNPLLIYGAPGSGKTHLAHAVGNSILSAASQPHTVACVSCEALVEELLVALQENTLERWRARYRAVDSLIVDNFQAIDGRDRPQEELAHVIEALVRHGRRVVLTSDRPIEQFRLINSRLRERLEQGHAVEIRPAPALDRLGRDTPVPVGDEAAAPTIDVAVSPQFIETVDNRLAYRSGDHQALDSYFFDSEKVIADWPDLAGRLIEEYS